ncbi:hypothetical protein MMC31_007401 [Peltigera leucophlebia]|nr:hypothetical protein [Peltigera leucophlebia]
MSSSVYTYEAISAKLAKLAGPNPSPDDVMNAALQLSAVEIAILADNVTKDPPLTQDQKARFAVGLVQTFSGPAALKHLNEASNQAAQATDIIDKTFTKLLRELAIVDEDHPKVDPFAPKLQVIYDEDVFQGFDELVIPLCNDQNLTPAERKRIIDEFIEESKTHESQTRLMQEDFEEVQRRFAAFTATFRKWAKDREEAITANIAQLEKDLGEMNDKLDRMQASLNAMLAIAAATLPTTGILVGFFAPLAGFIIIGGLLVAGAAVATVVGLNFAIIGWFSFLFFRTWPSILHLNPNLSFLFSAQEKAIRETEDQIKDLDEELGRIRATRKGLEVLGEGALEKVDKNLYILMGIWKRAKVDAQIISDWLGAGAKLAEKPQYMVQNIDYAVRVYKQLAEYLLNYAYGVQVHRKKRELLKRRAKEHQQRRHIHQCSCGEVFAHGYAEGPLETEDN